MKKMLSLFCFAVLFLFSTELSAQPVREQVPVRQTPVFTLQEFLNPSLQHLTVPLPKNPVFNPYPSSRPMNKTTKFLLGLGADIIRGNQEKYPVYSLENAWMYPGPTVRYPETATEYELFLSRYHRYNNDAQ